MPAPCFARQGVVIRLATMIAVLLFGGSALASGDMRYFNVPAQSLAAALADFADRTGMAALIDAEVASGKTSTMVRGRLVPDDALRILLAGTGLSFRRVNDTAFAVGPNTSVQAPEGLADHRQRGEHHAYFARIQDLSARSLCAHPQINVGIRRSVVQVWIGAAGAIDAVHPVTIQSDDQVAALTERLLRTRLVAPPVGLPQPVTIVLRGDAAEGLCANTAPPTP